MRKQQKMTKEKSQGFLLLFVHEFFMISLARFILFYALKHTHTHTHKIYLAFPFYINKIRYFFPKL
jgi:hypothetical protein